MIRRLLYLTLALVLAGALAAHETRGAQGPWWAELSRKVSRLSPVFVEFAPVVASPTQAAPDAGGAASEEPLYWKGRQKVIKVGKDELAGFKEALSILEDGDAQASLERFQVFLEKYPQSELRQDALDAIYKLRTAPDEAVAEMSEYRAARERDDEALREEAEVPAPPSVTESGGESPPAEAGAEGTPPVDASEGASSPEGMPRAGGGEDDPAPVQGILMTPPGAAPPDMDFTRPRPPEESPADLTMPEMPEMPEEATPPAVTAPAPPEEAPADLTMPEMPEEATPPAITAPAPPEESPADLTAPGPDGGFMNGNGHGDKQDDGSGDEDAFPEGEGPVDWEDEEDSGGDGGDRETWGE